jgi:uncharacterized protein (DUF433 family)
MYQGYAHHGVGGARQLAAGLTPDEIVRSYPSLNLEAVQAAIAHAAELGRERVVAMPTAMPA